MVKPTTQHVVIQNYVTMFLLWNLANEKMYGKVFTGAGRISWTNISASMKEDIDKLRMRVFPRFGASTDFHFNDTPVFKGFYSDPYTKQLIDAQNPAVLAPLADRHPSCKHQKSPGYVLSWDRNLTYKSPSILLECGQNLMTAGYSSIAFDAIQINNGLLNNQGAIPVGVTVGLANSAATMKTSALVKVNIEPSRMVYAKSKPFGEWLFRSVVSTIRVPLSSFKLMDGQWDEFRKLYLDFSSSSYPRGYIALSGFRGSFA